MVAGGERSDEGSDGDSDDGAGGEGFQRSRVLVIVLAGGAGGRLESLTDQRAKPAVPFGGIYRLIDFPLTNASHSGLSDVWVVQQFNPVSLSDHLANGRPWDLDRTSGGLLVLQPRLGSAGAGWHRGTADALWRNSQLIAEFDPSAVVVLSADAVYRLDYAAVVAAHRASGADVTMVTARVPRQDAGRYGVVEVDGDRITSYAYKPDEPASDIVTNEVFVFSPQPMLRLLDEFGRDADEEEGLGDLGDQLLPRLVDSGGARDHRFTDYWRDVGTVPAYWQAHMELLGTDPAFELDDPRWPLRTVGGRRGPGRVLAGAEIADSLLSPGAAVAGTVVRSVLSPGVRVEPGATVTDSVVLHDTVIRSGARVERAVVDASSEVGAGAEVGGPADGSAPNTAITLVGQGCAVPPGARLAPGVRFPERD